MTHARTFGGAGQSGAKPGSVHRRRSGRIGAQQREQRGDVRRQRAFERERRTGHRVREPQAASRAALAGGSLATPRAARRSAPAATSAGRRRRDRRAAARECAPCARESDACGPSRARARSTCARENARARGNACAPHGRSSTTAIFVRSRRWRPIGASTLPPPVSTPWQTARYVRLISRRSSAAVSAVWLAKVRATSNRPLVSLSSRWTRPARGNSASSG